MMKKQSYVVTFRSEPSTMERNQSSRNLLIDHSHQESTGGKMEESGNGTKRESGGCGTTSARLRDKFRGCLLGSLVGDCIGTLFERDYSVSYTLLEDLYHSLTNLSEDEKLMDLHGIDSDLGAKRIREILETKRQSYANLVTSDMDPEDVPMQLKPHEGNPFLRRNSAMESGTTPFVDMSRRGSSSRPIERYSDDTVMTKSVLYSMIKCKGFDARHMSQQLTEDYFLNMNRKFGGYIRDILVQLRENGYGEPYGPAKKYSNGIGAQGNESASRVSPMALFYWDPQEQQIVIDCASKQSKLTNAHKASIHGSVLQALAVHAAFNWDLPQDAYSCSTCGGGRESTNIPSMRHSSGSPLLMRRRQSNHAIRLELPSTRVQVEQQPKFFCEQILEKMNAIEGRGSSLFENLKHLVQQSTTSSGKEFLRPAEPRYCDKLRTILEFLARSQPPTRIEVIERLGSGFKSIDSVPTALYSFLFANKYDMLPEMTTPIKSPILRCIFHAISLGGETDTLASMAGAIAGAYWGYSQIPSEILRVCEGSKEVMKMADELFHLTYKSRLCSACQQ